MVLMGGGLVRAQTRRSSFDALLFTPTSIARCNAQTAGMTHFGDFEPLCHQVPSYPWCNLFYRQVHRYSSLALRLD